MKVCSRCRESLPANRDNFHKAKKAKDGLNTYCKDCAKARARDWAKKNREAKAAADRDYAQRNKARIANYQSRYRAGNAEKASEYHKAYREANKQRLREARRQYHARPEVRERRNRQQRERRARDKKYALVCSMRSAISERMSGKAVGAIRHAPWSTDELIAHIERQFQPGMSWDNYGEWHVDHITPDSSFDYKAPNDEGFLQSWSLSNLRPMWASENMSKQDKITHLI